MENVFENEIVAVYAGDNGEEIVEYSDGTFCWYVGNDLHREDGPAVIHSDGSKEWYINGEQLLESEYQNLSVNI